MKQRRWLKLDQRFPFGNTTTRIQEKFGLAGLAVWICLLAEAKRHVPEGHVQYVNDHHFWNLLGLSGHEPEFTPEAFLTFTGHLKQTKRRRSGRVTDVILTRWGDWQDDWRREEARERMSRKREVSDANTVRTQNEQLENEIRTEIEREIEIEKNLAPGARTTRKPDPLWDALTAELGEPQTASERGRRNKALAEFREAGATADDIRSRCAVYRNKWPGLDLTATALAANWTLMSPSGAKPVEDPGDRVARLMKERGL